MNNGGENIRMYFKIPKEHVNEGEMIALDEDLMSLNKVSDDIDTLRTALHSLNRQDIARETTDLISKLLRSQVKMSNELLEEIESTFYDVAKIENEGAE
ncbi:hypothetical protein A2G24_01100 [Listeria monocytogenes]|uniref:Uncharacterized protein n=1 Tax=Listeria monocytogenes TaxID=1639 RepID=A0A823DEA5_LISMN|nr:hypothetical protein [Listeria monocytogenes]EAD1012224.1 hypothetical protein [Listeria monocytogenes]EAD1186131.1 hypothetical protein [Listeria monocytogenes]EAF8898049.1 hypothetical protein [Listeria monocytogenes]